MNIFFCGIGGAGIGPLALLAHQAGHSVSGSDKQDGPYISYLKKQGIDKIYITQDAAAITNSHRTHPIDWVVYSSALPKENPSHPEILFARENTIPCTKRDEFLNYLLNEHNLNLIAIAGTHGKTTTTAMMIWLLKQLNIPISYSVGAKLSFGKFAEFDATSNYFVYECDEYDRNFLSFSPYMSLITGVDYDHADVYPTRQSYNEAFVSFVKQSEQAVMWRSDIERLDLTPSINTVVIHEDDPTIELDLHLAGVVNRQDAWQVAWAVHRLFDKPFSEIIPILDKFPGVSRRFEKVSEGIYTDYAHTPMKIRGALQLAHEVAGDNVVVVYEGLHNTRQHFIKQDLKDLFAGVKKLYIVPTYRAREDENLENLTPKKLCRLMQQPTERESAHLDETLQRSILQHIQDGDLVLCLSAGGADSLDEWLRRTLPTN